MANPSLIEVTGLSKALFWHEYCARGDHVYYNGKCVVCLATPEDDSPLNTVLTSFPGEPCTNYNGACLYCTNPKYWVKDKK